MGKKLMVIFSDNVDVSNNVLGEYPDGLGAVMEWIKADMEELKDNEEKEEAEFTITFKWMTQEEIDNLPEAE